MKYRPHVDGLRAVAIFFILLFHAGLNLFPSGFIGVDMFFVISGFLITGLIHTSLENNDFSFIEFYKRRLWRLQPLFICLILVTTILALLFYIPEDLFSYSKSARKASLFLSNQYFSRATKGYFAENTDYLPLLHTWSLSVEWQYYLILPLLIYLLYRVFSKTLMTKLIYLSTLALFALSLHYSATAPEKTYYQLLSRIFEFLIGSCVALTPRRFAFNPYFLNLINFLAFVSLFYIARLSGINLGAPNYYTCLACLATALLIATGEVEVKPLCLRLLSLKPIVFIGLISYSLYIWHWPVFAFIRYLSLAETTTTLIFAFSIILIISYLSWRFIERPARKLHRSPLGYALVFLFILPVILFHLNAYGIKKFEGYPQRFAETRRIYPLLKEYSTVQKYHCLRTPMTKNNTINSDCLLGAKPAGTGSRRGFMIGDSFSNHHWQFMNLFAQNANLSVLAHATAGCLSLPGIAQYDWLEGKRGIYHACLEQNKLYYKMIKENHYDFVIIAQYWNGYLSPRIVNQAEDQQTLKLTKARIEKAMDQALKTIIASGARPVLIKSVALPQKNPYDCFYQHIKRRAKYKPEQCDFRFDPKEQRWFDKLFAKMQKKYAQLILIDPKKIQCLNGLCKADIDGVPVFRDVTHITDYASYYLASSYLKRYKNPLVA